MKMICILCDQSFSLSKMQEKKVKKHPHKIQICPTCYERITKQVVERQQKKETSVTSEDSLLKQEDLTYLND
ncbi:DUF2197 domain-containing protein [Thermoflavimicrobium dichotomicum]|uniref:DUF2197 domain-containing protein n=1 Tax=Thermoflavimicrobium dichotomicum TaxID=46223 RepID=A0A1I3N9J6_9BACL|nr:DUF2197 domain-containing protein [Thermoflavimicrobium dichotomicum]SFJ05496.1 hypothetical protein SAMN05421852_10438 [Thermoflavimicrobium dichotomicum]